MKSSTFPVEGGIVCEVVRTSRGGNGLESVEIRLFHVDNEEGVSSFVVTRDQLRHLDEGRRDHLALEGVVRSLHPIRYVVITVATRPAARDVKHDAFSRCARLRSARRRLR